MTIIRKAPRRYGDPNPTRSSMGYADKDM